MFFLKKKVLVAVAFVFGVGFLVSADDKPINLQINMVPFKFGERSFAVDRPNGAIIKIISRERRSSCTAFVVDAGFAITAAHCVSDAKGLLAKDPLEVYNSESEYLNITAVPVGLNHLLDYAVITADFSHFKSFKYNFSEDTIKYGKKYISCGFPFSQKHFRCSDLYVKGNRFFTYTAKGSMIFPGQSGGPVIDSDTDMVVGVNSAVDEDGVVMFNSLIGIHAVFGLE